jgi:carbohydrate-binding DOMON domain-containing protein
LRLLVRHANTKTVASTFASFCQNFSDACDAAALTEPTDSATETDTSTEATTTEDSTATEETGTSTDTQTQAGSDTTSEPDAGVSLRVSAVAGLVTLFALLLVL